MDVIIRSYYVVTGALIKKAQQEASQNGGHKSCISPSIPSCTVSDVSSAHVSLLPESPTVIKETINLVTPTTVSTEDGQTTRPHKRPHHKEKSKSTSGQFYSPQLAAYLLYTITH